MKKLIKLPAVLLGLMLLFSGLTQKAIAQEYDDISLQSFYDELSPYGTWIQDPQYGNVWRPDVDQSDFRPYYTDGRWVMTEYGNTWVSDYDWGWAPFHYGRWITNRFNQWVWIPDTVWGPAWVSWRSGGGYYGWAPLGPGFSININIGGGGGYYNTPNNWWNFVSQRDIYSNRYPRYSSRNITIINRTTIINNTYGRGGRNTYYTGPRAEDIRRATNRDVRVYNVSRSETPGRTSITNNNINIYNPRSGGRSGNVNPSRSGDVNNSRSGNVNPSRSGDVNNSRSGNVNPSRSGNNVVGTPYQPGRTSSDVNNRGGQSRQDQTQQIQQQRDAQQRQQQMQQQQRQQQVQQQQRQQQDQQRQQQQQAQQRDAQQRQQQAQQQAQQRDAQQRQQQDQQRQRQQQMQQQQRQQQDQQRQQQQRQQQEQQRQQQEQQRQQQDSRSSGGDAPQRSDSRGGRN